MDSDLRPTCDMKTCVPHCNQACVNACKSFWLYYMLAALYVLSVTTQCYFLLYRKNWRHVGSRCICCVKRCISYLLYSVCRFRRFVLYIIDHPLYHVALQTCLLCSIITYFASRVGMLPVVVIKSLELVSSVCASVLTVWFACVITFAYAI